MHNYNAYEAFFLNCEICGLWDRAMLILPYCKNVKSRTSSQLPYIFEKRKDASSMNPSTKIVKFMAHGARAQALWQGWYCHKVKCINSLKSYHIH